MDKYIIETSHEGEVVNNVYTDLISTNSYKKILFVRSSTTGCWLDFIDEDNINITRILYDTYRSRNKFSYHKKTKIVHQSEFEIYMRSLGEKFDLICVDPFHEYTESRRDLFLLSSLLTENGILLSHDCYPINLLSASPVFTTGTWSGETYITLVELAYNHSEWFYTVLNTDTGVGIISKKYIEGLSNSLNREKQKLLLENRDYNYYCENFKDLINGFS